MRFTAWLVLHRDAHALVGQLDRGARGARRDRAGHRYRRAARDRARDSSCLSRSMAFGRSFAALAREGLEDHSRRSASPAAACISRCSGSACTTPPRPAASSISRCRQSSSCVMAAPLGERIGPRQWGGRRDLVLRRLPHRHAGPARGPLVQYRRHDGARLDDDVGGLHGAAARAPRRAQRRSSCS